MPIHEYSQPYARPLIMPNASIGIGQYDLSQQVSPPIVYKIGPFFKKKRVYYHAYLIILSLSHEGYVNIFV